MEGYTLLKTGIPIKQVSVESWPQTFLYPAWVGHSSMRQVGAGLLKNYVYPTQQSQIAILSPCNDSDGLENWTLPVEFRIFSHEKLWSMLSILKWSGFHSRPQISFEVLNVAVQLYQKRCWVLELFTLVTVLNCLESDVHPVCNLLERCKCSAATSILKSIYRM